MQFLLLFGCLLLVFAAVYAAFLFYRKVRNNERRKKKSYSGLKPMQWEEIVKECQDVGMNFLLHVSEVVYSEDGATRAVILKRKDGTYEIEVEKLYPYDDDELPYMDYHGFWHTITDGKTITDTIERARQITRDNNLLYKDIE